MVFALTPAAQRHLGLQFEKRQVKKAYLARLWGEMAEREGRVDLPLIVDWPNRPKQMVDPVNGSRAPGWARTALWLLGPLVPAMVVALRVL